MRNMSLIIRHCTVDEIANAPNIAALTDEYAAESHNAELPPPNVQWDYYRALENAGVLLPVAAHLDDELIGFAGLIINKLPHHGALFAVTESFFVAKAHRKSGAGLRLLRFVEQKAREYGSPCLMVSAPHGGQLEQVMPRVGYRHANTIFVRRLAA